MQGEFKGAETDRAPGDFAVPQFAFVHHVDAADPDGGGGVGIGNDLDVIVGPPVVDRD